MCFEGMEENGSDKLDEFIESEKDKFFAGADCMCISGELTCEVTDGMVPVLNIQTTTGWTQRPLV